MDIVTRLVFICFLIIGCQSAYSYGRAGEGQLYTCRMPTDPTPRTGRGPSDACSGLTAWTIERFKDDYYGKDKSFVQPLKCSATMTAEPIPKPNPNGTCTTIYKTAQGNFTSTAGWTMKTDCVPYSARRGKPGEESGPCECQLGYKSDNRGGVPGCYPYTCGAKGSYTSVTQPDILMSTVGSLCTEGCVVTPEVVKVATDGQLYGVWPFRATGGFCDGKDASVPPVSTGENMPPAPQQCGKGMCPGDLNGQFMCVPCKGEKVKGPSSSASGVTGGADGKPGSHSTETETQCNGGFCKTTTTVKDGNGNVVGKIEKEDTTESFCKENPGLNICKNAQWSGSCGAYACEGDAVQCALSKRVHDSACEWEKVDDAWKATGNTAVAGGSRPDGHPFANAESSPLAFSSAIDTTNRLAGGCPSDVAISVAGRSYVIPWSQHCDKLQLVGNLMMSVCMLAAAMIVFRG